MIKFLFLSSLFFVGSLAGLLKPSDLPAIPKDGKLWVVLAAGSDGWSNYRHQADVCHAYQVVKSHGVPDENIIVFMEDDIAYNFLNPYPGNIINQPDGPNVYEGVPKDYTGRDVNSVNFLKALQGEETNAGSGKIVNSGPNDHIFIFYSDHGSPGLVSFVHDTLYADDLNNAILKMHANNRYGKMVFYIEACEAGSMFRNLLPENINVYATTATDHLVSSYACYYDQTRNAYLGDEYSVAWMEYSDAENLFERDLEHQFEMVKIKTVSSPVSRYGDLGFTNLKVIEFQGVSSAQTKKSLPSTHSAEDRVVSYEVPRVLLEQKVKRAKSKSQRDVAIQELTTLLSKRSAMTKVTQDIVKKVVNDEKVATEVLEKTLELNQFNCYFSAARAYDSHCYKYHCNDYALRQNFALVNLCEHGYSSTDIVNAILNVCQENHHQECGTL